MKKRYVTVLAGILSFTMCVCGSLTTAVFAADDTQEAASAVETSDEYSFPTVDDFAAGEKWDGKSEPSRDMDDWAPAYEVMAKLAEDAAQYADTAPVQTFTLACHDPFESAPGEFLTAWADAVTIATKGAIDFNIGYSGAHSGTMASLTDMISGVVDFDWTLPCYFKGYMPLTNVIQNPALNIPNATVGSYAMWELYKNSPEIQAEFADDGELLFVWTNCTSPLLYKGDKEITSTEDIKGNIRGNNGPAQMFIEEVGASVMGSPIGEVYNNISTGVFNYVITDWHGIKSFKFNEVANYYVDSNIGCSAYCLMANKTIWELVEALGYGDAIKSVSGDYLLNLVPIWNYWEAAGRYAAASSGGDIFVPSDEFGTDLQAVYERVAERWIKEQDDPETAKEIYDQADALIRKYTEIYG